MGFMDKISGGGILRKITGVTDQANATRANAQAQLDATAQAAKDQQAALQANAKAAADSQAQIAARSKVEDKVSQAAATPLGTADVQLDADQADSVTATAQKRKVAFGRNYSGGVQI